MTHTNIPLPGIGTHIPNPPLFSPSHYTEISRNQSASWDLRDLKNSPSWLQWYNLTNCSTKPKCNLYPLWATWTTRALNCFQFQQQILRSDAGRDWLPSDHQTLSITLSLCLSLSLSLCFEELKGRIIKTRLLHSRSEVAVLAGMLYLYNVI